MPYVSRMSSEKEAASRGSEGRSPLQNFSSPLEKCFGHSAKNLGHSHKTLRPPGVVSGFRAWIPCCQQQLECEWKPNLKTVRRLLRVLS